MMPTCARCHPELRDGARFCAACGASVPEAAARRTRPPGATSAAALGPVLKVWGALLGLNALLATLTLLEVAPWWLLEPAVSALAFPVVGLVALPDPVTRAALRTPGNRHGLWAVPLALGLCWLMMRGYWALLEPLGAKVLPAVDEEGRRLFVLTVLLVVVVPPLLEEWFFRGVLLAKLGEVMHAREGLIVQAALFSVLHMLQLVFPTHFVMGLLFGALRLRTGSPPWNGWVLYQDAGGGVSVAWRHT